MGGGIPCGSCGEEHEGGACPAPTGAVGTRRAATRWLWPCDAGHTGPPDIKWQIAPYGLPPLEGQAGTGMNPKEN